MSTLLVHDDVVPRAAREALHAANVAPPSDRGALLASAARILYDVTDLDCADVLELVGLPAQAIAVRRDTFEVERARDARGPRDYG